MLIFSMFVSGVEESGLVNAVLSRSIGLYSQVV